MVAHGRHGQGPVVEHDPAEGVVVDLGVAAVERRRRRPTGSARSSARRRCVDVIPMSPWNAPATCSSTVATFAFQPNRPDLALAGPGVGTRFARPEIPSPSASSGSWAVDEVVVGDRFEQTHADHLRRQPGRDHDVGRQRAVGQVLDRYVGPAQLVARCRRRRCRSRSRHGDQHPTLGRRRRGWRGPGAGRRRSVRGPGSPSGPMPGTESRSSSPSVESSSGPDGGAPRPSSRWHDEHDWALKVGPEAVAGLGRRRRGHPVLGEEAVADLELPRSLGAEPGRREAEGVPSTSSVRVERRPTRGLGSSSGRRRDAASADHSPQAASSEAARRDCGPADGTPSRTGRARHRPTDHSSTSIAEGVGAGGDVSASVLERRRWSPGSRSGPRCRRGRRRRGAGRTAPGSPRRASTLAVDLGRQGSAQVGVDLGDQVGEARTARRPG